MACEILIHRNKDNYSHSDIEKDKRGVYKKGYIVTGKTLPHPGWGNQERFEAGNFVIIKITDATWEELQEYQKTWELEIDYELVGSNLDIDGHRFRIFSVNPGVSFRGAITLQKAENYLNEWNVEIFSVNQNEIVIDILISDMVKSKGFWDLETLQGLTAQETNYVKATGEHTFDVDYSNFKTEVIDRNKVAKSLNAMLNSRNGVLGDYNLQNETFTFTISRLNVLKWFKKDLFDRVRKHNVLYRRQFYINSSAVNSLVQYSTNNNGEPYEVTKIQLAGYVNSFLDKADA